MTTILIVEDNDLVGGLLKEWLTRSDFDAVWVKDGAAGVAYAKHAQPELILMDLSLPVLDGWSATRQIKAHPETADIPIIAVTAHAIAGEHEKALAAGCDAYFSKPFEFKPLMERVHALIQRGRANRSAPF